MAIGAPPAGASRGRDTSRGAAGRHAFVLEVARGYLGTLWIANDPADTSGHGTTFVRHIAPIAMTNVRAALVEAVRWGQGAKLPHSSATLELVEGKTSLDVVMPAPEGEVLRTVLRTVALKHVPADPALLLGIARSLLLELHALHGHAAATSSKHGFGGVHPDSVFIDTAGHVRLFDVGSSAATSAREPWHSDPQRMGYFAPEQLEVKGVPDARTDVFAVGVMLWEALTNRRLFPGNDAKTVRERLQKGPIARLDATRSSASPGIATPISNVVARALERDPANRFSNAEEMANAIGGLELADAAAIGTWLASTADAAIAKRRQVVERVRAGGPLPGDSMPPPSPGTVLRPSQAPAAAKAQSAPPGASKSIPPRPGSPTPAPPAATAAPATPKPSAASIRPSAPPTSVKPTATPAPVSVRPAPPAVTPPPPASVRPPPSPPSPSPPAARPSAAPPAPRPSQAPPAPRPSVAPPRPGSSSAAPPAAPAPPPGPPPAATTATSGSDAPRPEMDSVDRESLDASEDLADEVEDDTSEVAHDIPEAPAPAAEAAPPPEAKVEEPKPPVEAASAPPVASTADKPLEEAPVAAATHETAEPPRSTKRPPELPASVAPPSPVQDLTWPTRDRGRAFRIGAAALALVLGIGIGGVVVARRRATNEVANKPVAQTVSALPVVISAPMPESPSASAEPAPPESAAAPPTPSATPPSEPAATQEPAHETPPPQPAPEVERKEPTTSSASSESSSGKHRSSGSHNTPNAGYKPGGI